MSSRHPFHTGFSLIDTLLGVGIFLVVTTALIQFTLTTLRAADNLDLQLRAQNAAREGIEIMENIRGTNAISFVTWETTPAEHPRDALRDLLMFSDLKSQQELCVALSPIPGNVPWKITKVACPALDDLTPPANSKVVDLKGVDSRLTRYIRIRKAEHSPTLRDFWRSLQYTSQLQHGPDDIIQIDAVVGWENHGRQQQLILRKALADWYQ